MFNTRQEQDFIGTIIGSYVLQDAVDWIAHTLTPDEVFSKDDLEAWALENGFVEED